MSALPCSTGSDFRVSGRKSRPGCQILDWTNEFIGSQPLTGKVEIAKAASGYGTQDRANHESGPGLAPRSRIEGIGGLKKHVDDCFPKADVGPLPQGLLDPGVHLVR